MCLKPTYRTPGPSLAVYCSSTVGGPAFKSRLSPVGCVERTEIHDLPLARNETRREVGRSVRSARSP